jgi:DNA ligase-1
MEAFVDLVEQLDRATGTHARVAALEAHFRVAPPADAAWALQLLLGRRRRRLITGRRLREIVGRHLGLPAWLVDDCHAQVGDSAETVALLLPPEEPAAPLRQPLHRWMEHTLPAVAALAGEEQAAALADLWAAVPRHELLVLHKLLTGGFRLGVSQGLVLRALARTAGLEESLLAHRLMGGFTPSAEAFTTLLDPAAGAAASRSRPYPFFLASPLEPRLLAEEDPAAWLAEWKWDGIRGQLLHRGGEAFLWSRGEELINAAFPELIALARLLPEGTVLDGEVLVWLPGAERPEPFAALQRRLGRRSPGATLLRQAPAAFVAYDLLERDGRDLRPEPLFQRRAALESLRSAPPPTPEAPGAGLLRLSSPLPLSAWEELEPLRAGARAAGAEGLMLKRLASPYLAGRRRGAWWKHKVQPMELDAVLLYAQAGSGRRANLFTDYTFGLWNGAGKLVTFAKAYSGLDDAAITELDRWIRRHTTERYGPVRAVEPLQVFTLAFEGIQPSRRHRSGLAVRFPRILRWRTDKPAREADTLATAEALLAALQGGSAKGAGA